MRWRAAVITVSDSRARGETTHDPSGDLIVSRLAELPADSTTRRLILLNLFAFFALLLTQVASPDGAGKSIGLFGFSPGVFLHGWLWQPFTYSFIHVGIIGTLFELLSLWFLAGFLEGLHSSSWVTGLYAASVLGTAVAATAI